MLHRGSKGGGFFFSGGDCPRTCIDKILADVTKMGFDFHQTEGQFRSVYANLLKKMSNIF